MVWTVEKGQKQEIEFYQLYDRLSVDRAINRHARGLDRSTGRLTDGVRGTETHLGRSTDNSSKSCDDRGLSVIDRAVDRKLGSVDRAVDQRRVRTVSGPNLELFWGFSSPPYK